MAACDAAPVPSVAGEHSSPAVACLAQIGHLLATAPSVDSALDHVLRHALAATRADTAECFLREPHSGQMVLAAIQGRQQTAFQQITRFRPGEGYPGLLAEGGEPLLTFDLGHDRRYLRSAVKAAGYQTYLCVPLLGPDQVVGSLHIASRRRDEGLAGDMPVLAGVAGTLAVAVARDQAQIGERLAAPPVLPAGSAADAAQHLRYRAATVLSQALATAAADGGVILRHDPAAGGLVALAAAGPYEGMGCRPGSPACHGERLACPLLDGPACEPLLLSLYAGPAAAAGARDGPRGTCGALAGRLSAAVCLPLALDGQLTGVLSVGWLRDQRLPTRMLPWLGRLAGSAALSLRSPIDGDEGGSVVRPSSFVRREHDWTDAVAGPGRAAWQPDGAGTSAVSLSAATASLAIHVLGGCAVAHRGVPADHEVWGRPKFRRLFGYLLTHRHRWVHREEVVEVFWPDLEFPAALHNLRVALAAVRRALDPDLPPGSSGCYVQRRSDLLRLALPADAWLDVAEFERLSRAALSPPPPDDSALAQLAAAIALYHGDYLPDDRFETWAIDERQRLLDIYLTVLDRLAAAWSARRRYERAIDYRRLLLARDPANEATHRGLMADLTAAGRRADALRQYQLCHALLRRELDTEPLPETTDLYRRILAGGAA